MFNGNQDIVFVIYVASLFHGGFSSRNINGTCCFPAGPLVSCSGCSCLENKRFAVAKGYRVVHDFVRFNHERCGILFFAITSTVCEFISQSPLVVIFSSYRQAFYREHRLGTERSVYRRAYSRISVCYHKCACRGGIAEKQSSVQIEHIVVVIVLVNGTA